MKPTLRTLAVVVSCVVGLSACQCAATPPPTRPAAKTKCADVRPTVRKDVSSSWPDNYASLQACTDGWAWVTVDTGMNGNVVSGYYRVQGKRWVKWQGWNKIYAFCATQVPAAASTKFKKAVLKEADGRICKKGEFQP